MHSAQVQTRASTPAQDGLCLTSVSLRVGAENLLNDISLTLQRQGTTVIMGPNGAGKSLLLRLAHGLIAPTTGQVTWQGTPIAPEITRQQALVFQKPVLLRRSAAANVDFVLKSRGIRNAAARDSALAQVGLIDKAQSPARRLSGGEQQRLALARALVTKPDVLLLDEPTTNLDPSATMKIEEIVQDAATQGTKVLFVTHDIGQARRLADDVVFLQRGQLTEQAAAHEFFAAPPQAKPPAPIWPGACMSDT